LKKNGYTLGAGIVKALGQNVQSVKVGDKVLLSFYSCASCAQCNASHPAYCESFQRENYPGRPGSMKLRTGEDVWANFFGQSSFSHYSIVRETSVVNVESLLHDEKELQLFAPLGCGFQTGMGAIQNITHAQATDVVMVLGMGAVGMGALMVRS
jgi:Zn-dependent alcohol dehydrogenase